jgi:hypothetical protein
MSITSPLVYNRGCDNLAEVETPHWRDRLRAEEELLEQLEAKAEAARRRRAQALKDGVDELGSVYAVAKDRGRSWTAVDNALKKYTTE